jgi:phage tail-like protein
MPVPPSGAGKAITASRFSITVDGVEIAQFSELVGITSEAEPDDIVGIVLKKLPGKRKPPTVTLRRALTADTQVWAWHESAVEGRAGETTKDAVLVMFDAAGEPLVTYHLRGAWVPKIEIGALKAGSDEVLMETVTIACDTAQRVAS